MKDLIGRAMLDYYRNPKNFRKLWVAYPDGSRDEMPVATYFRPWKKMPFLEEIALRECRGKVLDIGAGAGSHALVLQEDGYDVTALDFSPGAAEVARQRGVQKVVEGNVFTFTEGGFDTLLLLMNGIGLSGNIAGLKTFLAHAETLLAPGGQLLFDSSDVSYLYGDGTPLPDHYYGEVQCRYEYEGEATDWFTWLYIDQARLQHIAEATGWKQQLLFEDDEGQFLVRLTRSGDLGESVG